jgi:recombination associated protein RdgC
VFKNLTLYRIAPGWAPSLDAMEKALDGARFVPCSATQDKSLGWVEPRGDAHGPLVEAVAGQRILKLQIETKSVPGAVVRRKAQEAADHIEATTGRKPGKKAKKDLKEQATHELLPRAFTKTSATQVWIAPKEGLLFVDAGSSSRADEVVTLLIQASPGLSLQLVQTAESPAACMAAWLLDGVTPEGFQIERECELKGSDEQKPVVRYARHPLDIDEVRAHLTSGKMPTRLALSWRERVAFTLTEGFTIKKISFLDLAFEGRPEASGDEAFDADLALATGELGRLIPALIEGLGGEHDFAAAGTAAAPAALPAPVPEEALSESPPW